MPRGVAVTHQRLRGKRSLDYMLRSLRRENLTIADLGVRYNQPVGIIINYLRERGYDMHGRPLPKTTKEEPQLRPLSLSAGGSAHYVAATDSDAPALPLRPVRYRNASPKPEGLDWAAISPGTACECGNSDHAPTCPAWTAQDGISRQKRRWVNTTRGRVRAAGSPYSRPGPAPKLTPEQHALIRAKYDAGASAKGLASEYGVADVTIANAIRRAGGTTRGRRTYSKRQHQQAFEEAS